MAYKILRPLAYVGQIETLVYNLTLAKSLIDQIYNIFEDVGCLNVNDEKKVKVDQIGYLLRAFEKELDNTIKELEETLKDFRASLILPDIRK